MSVCVCGAELLIESGSPEGVGRLLKPASPFFFMHCCWFNMKVRQSLVNWLCVHKTRELEKEGYGTPGNLYSS